MLLNICRNQSRSSRGGWNGGPRNNFLGKLKKLGLSV
jgi:hypothetical protein